MLWFGGVTSPQEEGSQEFPSLKMHTFGAISSTAYSLQVVVVTDYAEGELYQILEDDGKLPEDQVFPAETSPAPDFSSG